MTPVWTLAGSVLDDAPKLAFAGLVILLGLLATWVACDGRSRAAAWLRRVWRGSERLLPILVTALAIAAFVVVAEDVLKREQDEAVLRTDQWLRRTIRAVAAEPGVRAWASAMSHATGEGVLVAVAVAAVWLVTRGRRRDATVVAGGTLGAWLLSAGLKLAFSVARPRPRPSSHAITAYGFPSAHVLVTVVACGLVAWALARGPSIRGRAALWSSAVAGGSVAGMARIILDAHWLSDVVGGLAVGLVWLNVVVFLTPDVGG